MAVPTFRDLDGNSAIRLSCLYSKFLSSDSCRLSQNSRSDTAGPNPRGKTFTPLTGVTDASFRRALLKLINLKLSEFHAALPSQALEKAKETGGSAPPLDFPLVQPQPAQPGSMLEHVIPRGRWNPTRRSARQPETVPVKPSSRQVPFLNLGSTAMSSSNQHRPKQALVMATSYLQCQVRLDFDLL